MESNAANPQPASGKPASGCFTCETAIPLLERCLGSEPVNHFRNSRIEFLKGVRALIDARIAQLSKTAEPHGTHVAVE